MHHILLVEDDEMIASGLVYALTQEGYRVTHCPDLASAGKALGSGPYALGLLDLGLPDGSGFALGRRLREAGIPVVFLTAVDDEGNVVRGLEMGAEDYITKPFRLRELMARLAAVLRRNGNEPRAAVLEVPGGVRIDTLRAKVYLRGAEVELTALEYRLLLVFANHMGQVLTRPALLEGIWDAAGSFVNDNTLSVYIKRLRDKLEDGGRNPGIIKTVRGMGYKLGD